MTAWAARSAIAGVAVAGRRQVKDLPLCPLALFAFFVLFAFFAFFAFQILLPGLRGTGCGRQSDSEAI